MINSKKKKMKNYLSKIAMLFLSLAMLHACKSDDDDGGGDPPNPNSENNLILGASAEDILSDDIYNRLVVEFVYVEGFRPEQESIDAFRTFLIERVNKPGGISFVETVIDPPPGEPYNSQEIRDIEDANRTRFTNGDELAVYVFFSNGSSFGDTQNSVTLGSAYRNTSMVVFEKTLRSLVVNNSNFDLGILEITTINHEFGHILGLTNILDDDIHDDHEDPFRSKHCVVEECLMFFEAQAPTRSMMDRLMRMAEAPQLDPLCIADLQAKGGK